MKTNKTVGQLRIGAEFRPNGVWYKKTAELKDVDTPGPCWGNGNICIRLTDGGRVNFDPEVQAIETRHMSKMPKKWTP